ncbi:MAG: hypothetical protein FWC45_07450 [Treponema sp.]|nr:hypothetical protein [Treponema sp.]
MNRTVTIEIIDSAALRFLRDLETISLIRFTQEITADDDQVTAHINRICEQEDTSIEPCLMAAQAEVIDKEDW